MNNQPHGEELCKTPVDVHAFCKQLNNIQHQKKVRLKNHCMHDTGFHLNLESNNADCGDLIDLMKPEREPSTILFWQRDLSRTEVLNDHLFVSRILIWICLG